MQAEPEIGDTGRAAFDDTPEQDDAWQAAASKILAAERVPAFRRVTVKVGNATLIVTAEGWKTDDLVLRKRAQRVTQRISAKSEDPVWDYAVIMAEALQGRIVSGSS
jgi:hypothetical protein